MFLCINTANVAHARAQIEAVVRGQAVAAADGSALSDAAVTLTPAGTGEAVQTTADAAGRFLFAGIRPGVYVLSVARDGFAPREVRVVVEPREVRSLTVALDIAGIAVSVKVSGDAPLPSTHSPSSTLLTSDALESMPVLQRTNLPEALVTAAPGMIRGHDDFVHVRGQEVALNPLINGVSFWENPHGLFSSGLSPDVIESANVMTGGFSAQYGNRFGGIVDIVTKSGFTLRNAGSVTLSAGDAGRRNAGGEFGGSRGRLGYYTYGAFSESDRFLGPPDPSAIHDEGRSAHLFVQLDAALGAAGALRGIVMGDGANFQIPKTPLDMELRPAARADQRTRQQTAIAGWSRAWSGAFVSASGYERWSRSRLLPASGQLTARASLVRELVTLGGKVDVTGSAGRHLLKVGTDIVRLHPREDLTYDYAGYNAFTHLVGLPHIHITGQTITFSGRDTGDQASAYVQDTVQIGTRVTADLGVRVDHYTLVTAATHASPRANLAIETGGGAVIHASYNRFFVPPPIEGVLSNGAGLTRSIREIGRALPGIDPTIEDQLETGVTTRVGVLQTALTGYFRAIDGPVHTTVWPDSRIYSYASFDRGRAYGLELRGDAPGLARYGVSAYVNYAAGRVDFQNPVTGGFVTDAAHLSETNRFPAPMDQTHTLTGGLTYRHAATGLWAGTTIAYGSGTPIGHGGDHGHDAADADHGPAHPDGRVARVPGYTAADVTFGVDLLRDGHRRPRLILRLDVQNLTNDVYVIARESEFSPAQYWVPRLISATARIQF
ncbi:MAG: TonB-dependent receptor [Acidobacteria bacterium]|nr:TonB-dependent receptor [Acidobacteriota bacterium]